MTIGMNETLKNKLSGGIDAEKFAKKDEFTTQDFSTISNQFKNIFNNQFDKQFQSQFDYKQMFSNDSNKSDFMSNTASKMSDEKYFSQSYAVSNTNTDNMNSQINQTKNIESSKSTFEQNSNKNTSVEEKSQVYQQVNTTAENNSTKTVEKEKVSKDEKNPEQAKVEIKSEDSKDVKESKELSENIQNATVLTQILAMMGNIQKVQQKTAEKDLNPSILKSDKIDKFEKASNKEKDNKILVSVKDTELKKAETLIADESVIPKLDVKLTKDVKIEKLDIKIKHKENIQENIDTNKKAEKTPKEDIQNKVSLERLTANVISKNPEISNELDAFLNKDIIKKVDTGTKHNIVSNEKADAKIQTDLKNSFMNNQNFGQNLNQGFGQANQEAQAQLKANILASNMTLDASLHKSNFQGNLQTNNLIQSNQTNNMLEKNIFDQVMKNIQGNISAEKSEVTMILKPENLGKVTLNIMNEKGIVSAELKAETQEAADALNKNIQDLKETLKQQGVICANLVVKLEEPNRSENNMQFAQQEQNLKDFSQGNAQNSDKDSFENKSNNQSAKNEFNKDIREEQEQPAQKAKDDSLVDYRV